MNGICYKNKLEQKWCSVALYFISQNTPFWNSVKPNMHFSPPLITSEYNYNAKTWVHPAGQTSCLARWPPSPCECHGHPSGACPRHPAAPGVLEVLPPRAEERSNFLPCLKALRWPARCWRKENTALPGTVQTKSGTLPCFFPSAHACRSARLQERSGCNKLLQSFALLRCSVRFT